MSVKPSHAVPLLEHRENASRSHFMVTLGPGDVRYFSRADFLQANVDELIFQLRILSKEPLLKPPAQVLEARDNFRLKLDFADVEAIAKEAAWDVKLRIYHGLGQLFLNSRLPSWVYRSFHTHLQLDDVAFAECLDALEWKALDNPDVVDSYRDSPTYMVLNECGDSLFDLTCVIKRTAFVTNRLELLARKSEEAKAEAERLRAESSAREARQRDARETEALQRSKYDCFVYLMEDQRNNSFKIGRSKTPGKRERTLQSEVPQIVMRFSIPAEEQTESELHFKYEPKRIRGEWFSLNAEDVVSIVCFLKARGDVSRASVDYHWLGKIWLESP